MLVSKALLGTTYFNLLLRVILADDGCKKNCPDPFPPGHQNIGDAWWAIGNEASGAYITDITTTLEVPPKPAGVEGLRLINSALDNSNVSDVTDSNAAKEEFQILLAAFPDPPFGGCEATGDQWCLFTSYYSEKNGKSLVQFPMTTVNPGDAIRLTHTYNLDVGVQVTYQDLNLGPNVTESPTTNPISPPFQWWPNTECHCHGTGVIPRHTYLDTVIRLGSAVPDYDSYIVSQNAEYSPIATSDGGTTWHMDFLTIDESYCREDKAACS